MNYASLTKTEVDEYGFPTKGEHFLVNNLANVGNITLTGDLYLCLNGHDLTGITFSGNYRVFITNCVGFGGEGAPSENKVLNASKLEPVDDRELFNNKEAYVYGHKVSNESSYDETENHNIVITTNTVNNNSAVTLEGVTVAGVENENQTNVVSGKNVVLRDVTFKNMNAEGTQVLQLDNAIATISDVKLKNVKADYFMITKNNSSLALKDNKFSGATFEKSVVMLGEGTKTTLSGTNEFIGNTLGTAENSVSEAVFKIALNNNSSFTLTKDSTITIKENCTTFTVCSVVGKITISHITITIEVNCTTST